MASIRSERQESCLTAFVAAPIQKSFVYQSLPPPRQLLINLSVLKLGGSAFEVKIAKTATVKELQEAIESVSGESTKDEQTKIDWAHVWSYFCLSYKELKLDDENAHIRFCGIKDGDQLRFVRRLSIF